MWDAIPLSKLRNRYILTYKYLKLLNIENEPNMKYMNNYGELILIFYDRVDKRTKSPFFLFGVMCKFFTQVVGCRSFPE